MALGGMFERAEQGRDREGESDEPELPRRCHNAGLWQHTALSLPSVLTPPQHTLQLAPAASPHPGTLRLGPSLAAPPQPDRQDSVSSQPPLSSHSQRHLSLAHQDKERVSTPPGEFLRRQYSRAKLPAA